MKVGAELEVLVDLGLVFLLAVIRGVVEARLHGPQEVRMLHELRVEVVRLGRFGCLAPIRVRPTRLVLRVRQEEQVLLLLGAFTGRHAQELVLVHVLTLRSPDLSPSFLFVFVPIASDQSGGGSVRHFIITSSSLFQN